MTSALARPQGQVGYQPTGFQMIKSIEIRNFRCFERLSADGCRRINVIVGDNGAGKTALLEALFLTLAGNMEISLRLRAQRGLEGQFAGSPRAIEEAIWRDYFHNLDWSRSILVELKGTGVEARSMSIARGQSQLFVPLSGSGGDESQPSLVGPLTFTWKSASGESFVYHPKIGASGIQLELPQEDLPDFFLFAANQVPGARENADKFSVLSKSRRERQFVDLFIKEYDWIEDLSLESAGGAPVIHATVKGVPEKLPLNLVSGAINRVTGILLSMASRPTSVLLVDEMENGIYYKHQVSLWKSVLAFARKFDSQLFATTHNEEWLEALAAAANGDVDDIALWRLEREATGPALRQFTGKQAVAAMASGEVR